MEKFEINWLEDKSDEAVLEEIRRVAALVPNRYLTKATFNSFSKKIKSDTIWRRFGSWCEATRRAGLTHVLPDYADAAIIEDLQQVSESFPNDPFSCRFYSARGRYSSNLVARRFGGWQKALDAAGIGSRFVGKWFVGKRFSTMTNEDILAHLRTIYGRLGRANLNMADITANSEINGYLLRRRFGKVSTAFKQAGIEPVKYGRKYTEDEVLENILKVWTHYGRPPYLFEMNRAPSTVGQDAYKRRYGNWRKALKAFVEYANSEADGDPALDPEQGPSRPTDHADSTESPTTGTGDTNRPQPASQISVRPRVMRRVQTNVKPEDRREPSIGLRFKVFQRDKFRCRLCGQSPATDPSCILHADHIKPFKPISGYDGGKTTFENLQTLCLRCNIGKSNRSV